MKLSYLNLSRPVQTEQGLLRRGVYESPYEMFLHNRLGLIEIKAPHWDKSVYITRAPVDAIGFAEPIPRPDERR